MNPIKLIVFDIDKTLTADTSWIEITRGLRSSVSRHQKIYSDLLEKKLSYNEAKKQLITQWRLTGNANLDYMTLMFKSWKLKAEAKEVINYLKPKYKLVLLSGSVNLYVKVVAEQLDIQTWFANTTLQWGEDNTLVDFDYEVDQEKKKFLQLSTFLKENIFPWGECAVIGDGENDQLLFDKAGYSVLITENKTQTSVYNAVKVISNLKELMQIF